ncbi:MAG TPA: Trp family transcriptional regulator [Patescibacteria group bacterium]|nr:Trp family transcriptional regulator [Patescibacteria group bacterium]
MPQVSKRILNPEIKQNILDAFSYVLKELKTKKDVDLFLSTVLTETEQIMLSKRVAAAFLLDRGVEEGKISQTLKLTSATISRLKMWINLRMDGFKVIFSKLVKKEKEGMANELLQKVLNYAIKAAFGRVPKLF